MALRRFLACDLLVVACLDLSRHPRKKKEYEAHPTNGNDQPENRLGIPKGGITATAPLDERRFFTTASPSTLGEQEQDAVQPQDGAKRGPGPTTTKQSLLQVGRAAAKQQRREEASVSSAAAAKLFQFKRRERKQRLDFRMKTCSKDSKGNYLPLTVKDCTASGCKEQNAALVSEANWGCGGAKGLFSTEGDKITMGNARTYICDDDKCSKYKSYNFLNHEIALTMDLNKVPCYTNNAIYSIEMPMDGWAADGGFGAAVGDGYCDGQCPNDRQWIKGEADAPPGGKGQKGVCCMENDIWEGNKEANAFTMHNCRDPGITILPHSDEKATDKCGECDKAGCDFNAYRNGQHDFFGPGKTVDTKKPVTIVTQYNVNDAGELAEILRFWIQDGKKIDNASPTAKQIPGAEKMNTMTDAYCKLRGKSFDKSEKKPDCQADMGGLKQMGESFKKGHVLSLSLWNDEKTGMEWLDSYVSGGDGVHYESREEAAKEPGGERGACD
eukprot:g13130.t1